MDLIRRAWAAIRQSVAGEQYEVPLGLGLITFGLWAIWPPLAAVGLGALVLLSAMLRSRK